ncbi:MAG: histidine kinase N-terminal 7TM domain-containing protein [Bacteroidales bacterium]|nr:histidine kinase N-terminal 7TM domain-containing protein [Bacteroidales bacterium]
MSFTIFFYIFLATAFISFLVSFLAWKRREVHGALELSRLLFFTAEYAFVIAFEAASNTMEQKIFWTKIAYVGAVSVPVLYFLFVMRFTGNDKVGSLKNSLLLFIIPVITLILAITNEKHHLIWTGFSPISPQTNIMEYEHGIWFWIGYMVYDYLLLLFATVSLFHYIFRNKKTFRVQGWVVFIAGICPWIAGIIYLTNANPIPGFDISPASTMLSGLLLIYAILRVGFLDLVPIARETLVETLEDGIIALDAKNRVQDINGAACSFLGLPNKNILGKPVDFFDVIDQSLLDAIISSKDFDHFELEQGKITLRITKQDIKSKSGSRLVVIRNISEQIAKQREICAGEERYRNMYNLFRLMADNMSDMLWAKDLDKNFIFVNKAVCENLLGVSDIDEPIGKPYSFFRELEQRKHPECRDWFDFAFDNELDTDEEVIRSGKPNYFDESGNVRGECLSLDVRKAPIYNENGEMIGVVGSARDVTLQKKIEMDINKRDKLLNAITKATDLLVQGENLEESLHGCLEIMGKDTGINRIYFCRKDFDGIKPVLTLIYEWTDGSDASQVNGRDFGHPLVDLVLPDWYDKLSKGEVCLGKIHDFSNAERAILKSQKVRAILVAPIFIDKFFWGFIGFDDCVGEREWTSTEERLLKTAAATIASVYVRKMNQEELLSAKEKAEESDRLKTAFLANMSHEIRTPMNSILGFISLLQEPDLTGEERDEYFSIVKNAGKRLLNTIHDIIDISKIEARQMTIDFSNFDVNEMMGDFYQIFEPEAEAKGLTFNEPALLPKEQSLIKTDRSKVYSVMTNLIKNALKYTNDGVLEMGCVRSHKDILFFVKDTGIGIPENKRQAIFERFIQADISNTRTYEGSGLGLSISKAYVEMLGGTIWVESEFDQGSTFFFQIPVTNAPLNAVALTSDHMDAVFRETVPLNILVVEDDLINFEYVNIILRKDSHQVWHTFTGAEAVALCRQQAKFDIILMDIKLPDIDGYEVTRRIRSFDKKTPIIAISAFAFQDDREKALACGCNEYLSKPIKKELLLAALEKYSNDDPVRELIP